MPRDVLAWPERMLHQQRGRCDKASRSRRGLGGDPVGQTDPNGGDQPDHLRLPANKETLWTNHKELNLSRRNKILHIYKPYYRPILAVI